MNVTSIKKRGRGTSSTMPKGKKVLDVQFQPSKPRRSYKARGDRVVKVNVEQRFQNDNKLNELGFSMHKARLKAQMMNDMVHEDRPVDRHVYVRIAGSDKVREIIFDDGKG